MKYGINLLLWTDSMHDGLIPVVETLKDMGYDGVEMPLFEPNKDLYADWGKKLDAIGLERTAVTIRSADANPISSDASVRKAAVDALKKTIDCCHAAGVKLLAGPTHSAIGEFSGSGPTADEIKWGAESMRQAAEYAASADVTIVVEYLNRFENYFLTSVAQTISFLGEVDHPNLRMMYDTFHANIEEKNLSDAIDAAMPWTRLVHISENDRSTPGQGHVAWNETFDAIKKTNWDGWMVVEAFGLALPAIVAATKIWRKMYSTEEQLARDALSFMKTNVDKRWQ